MSIDLGRYIDLPPSTPESRVEFRISNALLSLSWEDRDLLYSLYINADHRGGLMRKMNMDRAMFLDRITNIEFRLMTAAAVSPKQLEQFWNTRHDEYSRTVTAVEGGTRLEIPWQLHG